MDTTATARTHVYEIVQRCLPALAALVDATEDVRMVAGEEMARQMYPLYTELNQFLLELQRAVVKGIPYPRGMSDLPIVRDTIRLYLELGREPTLAECQVMAFASRDVTVAALRDLMAVGFARPVWDVASPWMRYARATPRQGE